MKPSHALVVFIVLALFIPAAGAAEKLPPLKVIILAGQSNMVGAGRIAIDPRRENGGEGTLEYLVKNPKTAAQFKSLVDADGNWVKRDDVWIWDLGKTDSLGAGYAERTTIGPELGFGWRIGDYFDEQVLLIKISWGGKSLGVDFRPPSSGGEVGPYYKEMFAHIKDVLTNLKKYFPKYQGQGYELVGFGWHQGWNDRVNQGLNDAYEENLANFIRDLRKELGTPDLPFVIAETGMSGFEETHPRALSLMVHQAAVPAMDEFKDTTRFVGTKAFYRTPEHSPSGQQFHWNGNAETYWLIGDGMAKAMVELIED